MNFNSNQTQNTTKKEISQDEPLYEGKYFTPAADVIETAKALIIVLDMPGVDKDHVSVHLEENRLDIEGKLDVAAFEKRDPIYSEYNVGNYIRRFNLSNKINRDAIHAKMEHGVLTLTLPKVNDPTPKKILIQ